MRHVVRHLEKSTTTRKISSFNFNLCEKGDKVHDDCFQFTPNCCISPQLAVDSPQGAVISPNISVVSPQLLSFHLKLLSLYVETKDLRASLSTFRTNGCPFDHTWSTFPFPDLLLVMRGVYSHFLASYWSIIRRSDHKKILIYLGSSTLDINENIPHFT